MDMEEVATKLESLGGWAIDFDQEVEKPSLFETHSLDGKAIFDIRVLDNVVPNSWCSEWISKHEQIGYTSQWQIDRKLYNPLFYGDEEKKNTSQLITIVNPKLASFVWNRVNEFIPTQFIDLKGYTKGHWLKEGILPVFRFMRYCEGQYFKAHYDPTRVSEHFNGNYGYYKSFVTLALYLNDPKEFTGGELNFLKVEPTGNNGIVWNSIKKVKPAVGRMAIFQHSELHEGGAIDKGTKYMVQFDVLYKWVGDKKN